MKRNLEPVDLMAAVGVFATLLGGALLFVAASGRRNTVGCWSSVALSWSGGSTSRVTGYCASHWTSFCSLSGTQSYSFCCSY